MFDLGEIRVNFLQLRFGQPGQVLPQSAQCHSARLIDFRGSGEPRHVLIEHFLRFVIIENNPDVGIYRDGLLGERWPAQRRDHECCKNEVLFHNASRFL